MKLKIDKKIIGYLFLGLIVVLTGLLIINPLAIFVRMDFEDAFRDDLDVIVTVNGIEVYPNNPLGLQYVHVGDKVVIEGTFKDTRETVKKTSFFIGGYYDEYLMEDGTLVGGDNTYFKYTYTILDTVLAQSCSTMWIEQPDGTDILDKACISSTVKTSKLGLFLQESGGFPANRLFGVSLDIYHDDSDDNLVCEKHYVSLEDDTRTIQYVLRDYRDIVGVNKFNVRGTYDNNPDCIIARQNYLVYGSITPPDEENGEPITGGIVSSAIAKGLFMIIGLGVIGLVIFIVIKRKR